MKLVRPTEWLNTVSWRKGAPLNIEMDRTLDINPAREIINVATANAWPHRLVPTELIWRSATESLHGLSVWFRPIWVHIWSEDNQPAKGRRPNSSHFPQYATPFRTSIIGKHDAREREIRQLDPMSWVLMASVCEPRREIPINAEVHKSVRADT